MKSPRHCWRAASDAGDSWLQPTIPCHVLLDILNKTHIKQDIAPPSLYKQGKFQFMMSNVLHQHGKRLITYFCIYVGVYPTSVLSLLLVGILSKVMNIIFSLLQNSKPHSKRPEGRGATSSTSPVLDCSKSTWPCFLFIPGAVLYEPRGLKRETLPTSVTSYLCPCIKHYFSCP